MINLSLYPHIFPSGFTILIHKPDHLLIFPIPSPKPLTTDIPVESIFSCNLHSITLSLPWSCTVLKRTTIITVLLELQMRNHDIHFAIFFLPVIHGIIQFPWWLLHERGLGFHFPFPITDPKLGYHSSTLSCPLK